LGLGLNNTIGWYDAVAIFNIPSIPDVNPSGRQRKNKLPCFSDGQYPINFEG
jgi:hypothetical protein